MGRWPTFRELPLAVIAAAWAIVVATAYAAGDDDEIVTTTVVASPQHQFDLNANLDQWVFQGSQNAAAGRQRVQAQIDLQINEFEQVCELSKSQKQKLQLAARGDLQRFLDQVDLVRKKFAGAKHDQNAINEMWQLAQPLQARQARGLTGADSLLMKIVPATLTPEQLARYDAVTLERRKFRYQASIAIALTTLDGGVAFKHEQREALAKLLQAEPPPRVFGQYDHYLIMYRLAGMPPDKIRPLLDARQWEALKLQFDRYRGMRDFLIQQGMLTPEDLGEPKQAAAELLPLREALP